jgi:ABC-type multidrug transport system ATPase subunit
MVSSHAPARRELAIETADLVKTYGRTVRALDGLSFSVRAGTVSGLLGPNGAGKSTTVKMLNTLTRPDSGSRASRASTCCGRPTPYAA